MVGDKIIGYLPENIENSKVYIFECDVVGDFVEIVIGGGGGMDE